MLKLVKPLFAVLLTAAVATPVMAQTVVTPNGWEVIQQGEGYQPRYYRSRHRRVVVRPQYPYQYTQPGYGYGYSQPQYYQQPGFSLNFGF